jgi:hypothetical protein
MDLVRLERGIKRIAFEFLPCPANRLLLLVSELVEILPEFLDGAVPIHYAPGGVSFSAVSIETNR